MTWAILYNSLANKWIVGAAVSLLISSISYTSYLWMHFAYSPSYLTEISNAIYINFFILVLNTIILANKVLIFYKQHRGYNMHPKLILTFVLLAIIPTIFSTLFAFTSFNKSIGAWFDKNTRLILENSLEIAKHAIKEHKKSIQHSLSFAALQLQHHENYNTSLLNLICEYGDLDEAVLIAVDLPMQIVARSSYAATLEWESTDAKKHAKVRAALEQPGSNAIVEINKNHTKLLGYVRIQGKYLFLVSRYIDTRLLQYLSDTQGAELNYHNLYQHLGRLKIMIMLVLSILATTLIVFSIFIGFAFTNRLTRSIYQLIYAAQEVIQGNLKIKVVNSPSFEELNVLIDSFNLMLEKVDKNQEAVSHKQQETELILKSIPTALIGFDKLGNVIFHNQKAEELFGEVNNIEDLKEIIPYEKLTHLSNVLRLCEEQIVYKSLNLIVRTTRSTNSVLILTVIDITEISQAQKKADWGEMARRIAHEMKNPLTPIQLSAERLLRMSSNPDPELIKRIANTIIKQVKSIHLMVNAFNDLAKMPLLSKQEVNLTELLQEMMATYQHTYPHIDFYFKYTFIVVLYADKNLLKTALNNILLNAVEALESVVSKRIFCTYQLIEAQKVAIEIVDSGTGFEDLESLANAYFTTKSYGTGLGLNIVHKIITDHEGEMHFRNARPGEFRNVSRGILPGLAPSLSSNPSPNLSPDPSLEETIAGAERATDSQEVAECHLGGVVTIILPSVIRK